MSGEEIEREIEGLLAEMARAIADNADNYVMLINRQPANAADYLASWQEYAGLASEMVLGDAMYDDVRLALAEATKRVVAAAEFADTMGTGNLAWPGLEKEAGA